MTDISSPTKGTSEQAYFVFPDGESGGAGIGMFLWNQAEEKKLHIVHSPLQS